MSTENQTQELVIIDPKEYGLEPVKATEMTSVLNSIIEERKALEAMFNDVILKELNDDTLKEARSLRLNVRDNRTKGIEVWHKTNKAFYLAGGRFVDAVKNKEVAINERMESRLDEIENHFKVLEEKRLNQLKADRVALLEPYGEVNPFFDLKAMDEVTFNNLLADTKLAFETRKENERKAEEQRIADEKKAEEERLSKDKLIKDRTKILVDAGITFDGDLFFVGDTGILDLGSIHEKTEEVFQRLLNAGIEKVKSIKAEHERIEAENEKLRLENEAKEKELAKEREAQAEKDRLAKIESDRLVKIQAEKDAEIKKMQAELDAEKQRKEKELADEKARIEAEQADKLAKEKALANAGDKEKVKVFFTKFEELVKSFPELTSADGIDMSVKVKESLALVRGIIINESKKLV